MSGPSKYIFSKRIARGGMAEIFLGKMVGEGGFQKLVAIKKILPHLAAEGEFTNMFRDEANIGKRLNHANIVQIYSFEELDNSYAIIMEYVNGLDLRSLLSACEKSKMRPSVAIAVYVIAEAARGLHYAHTKVDEESGQTLDIVHRDVSPQNILISYEGEVKVTDFGIADAKKKETETKPGIVKGKYAYMSPEQLNGERDLDSRTDVFSLMIILWEMLAMRRLFSGESEVETIKLVQNCKLPFRLAEVNPDVDNELEAIIERGLAKDRKKRYQSAASLEKDLLHYLHSHYPAFTAGELGAFLRTLCPEKLTETQDDIRKTLTDSNLKPASIRFGDSSSGSIKLAPLQFDLEQGKSLKLQVPKTSSKMHSAMPRGSRPSGMTPPRKQQTGLRSRGMSKSSGFRGMNILTAAAGILILCALAVLARKTFLANDNSMQVYLRTEPANVRLAVDGKDIDSGSYKQTPVKLNLSPGKHTIRIARAGYQTAELALAGEAGALVKHDGVSLQRVSRFASVPVRIVSALGQENIDIAIDGGFLVGVTPYVTQELEAGKTHELVFFPDRRTKNTSFRCSFTPRPGRESFTVRVEYQAKSQPRCTVN